MDKEKDKPKDKPAIPLDEPLPTDPTNPPPPPDEDDNADGEIPGGGK